MTTTGTNEQKPTDMMLMQHLASMAECEITIAPRNREIRRAFKRAVRRLGGTWVQDGDDIHVRIPEQPGIKRLYPPGKRIFIVTATNNDPNLRFPAHWFPDDETVQRAAELEEEVTHRVFSDWDQRWREERYFCRYEIGQVAETFSFGRDDVIASIRTIGEFFLPQMLKDDHPPFGPIEILRREGIALVEYAARRRNGLEVLQCPASSLSDDVERLFGSAPPAPCDMTEAERACWDLMVFAMVLKFASAPVGDNCLVVRDVSPDELVDVEFLPHVTEEMKRDAARLGGREYYSMRIELN
jgi:hypothetical protein